jgi:hypothetical protein
MSSRKCGVQYYGSMDLWYVWSYPILCLDLWYVWSDLMSMSGAMVCVVYGSVVCLVLSYAWIYGMSGPILCLVLSYVWSYGMCGLWICGMSGPILCLDLWYVRSCRMSSRPTILIYVWLYPTSPRPAILMSGPILCRPRPASGFYVFRPITSDVGLCASVWSTQDHTRPPLGGVAPRRAEVPTGGTHTPVFDSTVREGRELGATCSPHAGRALWSASRAPTSELVQAASRAVSKMGM